MEFLMLVLLLIALILLWKFPDYENWVWGLILSAALIDVLMYAVASFDAFIPAGNY